MTLTNEELDAIVGEVKRIGATLNLSDEQKQKVQAFMAEASKNVKEYKQQNPNVTPQDLVKKVMNNRAALRQRLVDFLTPEQLNKWDAEVAQAKEFLGHKLAA